MTNRFIFEHFHIDLLFKNDIELCPVLQFAVKFNRGGLMFIKNAYW